MYRIQHIYSVYTSKKICNYKSNHFIFVIFKGICSFLKIYILLKLILFVDLINNNYNSIV